MIGLLVLVSVAIGVSILRTRVAQRAHQAVATRLTIGADGIVVGAAPIDLPAADGSGVLLLHGFGDTPQTLSYLAAYLQAQGWGVYVPLLPGHGRTLDVFATTRATDWIGAARDALGEMRTRYASVSIVGLSMGGSLATILAAESAEIPALVLLAPYLSMPTRLRRAASLHSVLGAVWPYLRGGGSGRSIRDPAEVPRNLAYGFTTPRLVYELSRVVARARAAAPRVTAPTLVVQSRQDHRIPPEAAERAFALFTTRERNLIWTEGNGHIITVDYGRQAIFSAVSDWLRGHAGTPGGAPNAAGMLEQPRTS